MEFSNRSSAIQSRISQVNPDGWHIRCLPDRPVPDLPTAPKKSRNEPRGESPKVSAKKRPACRIGFVPMIDCAPLIVAQELGLFAKHGIAVRLSRELGWATIREK